MLFLSTPVCFLLFPRFDAMVQQLRDVIVQCQNTRNYAIRARRRRRLTPLSWCTAAAARRARVDVDGGVAVHRRHDGGRTVLIVATASWVCRAPASKPHRDGTTPSRPYCLLTMRGCSHSAFRWLSSRQGLGRQSSNRSIDGLCPLAGLRQSLLEGRRCRSIRAAVEANSGRPGMIFCTESTKVWPLQCIGTTASGANVLSSATTWSV